MRKLKKVVSLATTVTMCAALLAGCGGSSKPAETAAPAAGAKTEAASADTAAAGAADDDFQMTIKFSNVFQPAEWNYKASEKLAEMVKERTEGHIILEYYGQNQLDCYAESVEQAHNGAVWMGLEEPSYFADYIGDYNVLVGPMLYASNEEYNAVMDTDIVKNLNARLAAENNIHILDTHYSFGFRNVCTNKVVEKPADLSGQMLRSTESPLFIQTITCLGATPSPMSFTECISAMSSGVVNGFEGSTSTLKDTGAYEYTKNVARTSHFIATRWLFMAEDVYQSIPEKWRTILDECCVEAGIWEQENAQNDEADMIKFLEEKGVTWNDVDTAAFTEACAPVYDWIVEEYKADPTLYPTLVEFLTEYRKK
ncbi:MAG: TRAP transporter substrate-binding protein DctP [Lachnospiraceae bacterium]|nr:TRAP transporter substrate-binding protein DctP [Lachnospiraceae bacterium]